MTPRHQEAHCSGTCVQLYDRLPIPLGNLVTILHLALSRGIAFPSTDSFGAIRVALLLT